MQVCAQVLLLREHGYTVGRGEIFYTQTRQRVVVEPTPELIARTLEITAGARATATRLAPPPPLQSSPKWPRCSLAGICLPDETNVLARRADSRPRRLITPNPDTSPLYVTESGALVGIDGGRLTVSKYRQPLASARLIDVLHVCAYGNVQVSAQALRSLFERDIDVFHFSYGGWLLGVTTGLPGKNVMLRIRQTIAAARGQLGEARQMIAGKIRNCRVLLRRNGGGTVSRIVGQLAGLALQAEKAADAAELLGFEGTAARLYFEAFPALIPRAAKLPGPTFTGLRNRRPPTDVVNCLLSFCYGMLTKEVMTACLAVWERRITTEVRHPMFGYTVSYRRAVELQARILAARLIGELPSYQPLVTR